MPRQGIGVGWAYMHHKALGQLLHNFGQEFYSIAVDNSSLLRCSSAKRFATSEEGEQFRTVIINVGTDCAGPQFQP